MRCSAAIVIRGRVLGGRLGIPRTILAGTTMRRSGMSSSRRPNFVFLRSGNASIWSDALVA